MRHALSKPLTQGLPQKIVSQVAIGQPDAPRRGIQKRRHGQATPVRRGHQPATRTEKI
jgi:hypothetical protein